MSKFNTEEAKIEGGSHLEAPDGSINGSTIRPSGEREKRFSPTEQHHASNPDAGPVVAMNIIENPLQASHLPCISASIKLIP